MFKSNKHTHFPHWVEAEDWLNREYASPRYTWNAWDQGELIALHCTVAGDSFEAFCTHSTFRQWVSENSFDWAMHQLVSKLHPEKFPSVRFDYDIGSKWDIDSKEENT